MMKAIPPYILEKLARREQRKREEHRQRIPLPAPLPIPLQDIPEPTERKEDYIIIDMGAST